MGQLWLCSFPSNWFLIGSNCACSIRTFGLTMLCSPVAQLSSDPVTLAHSSLPSRARTNSIKALSMNVAPHLLPAMVSSFPATATGGPTYGNSDLLQLDLLRFFITGHHLVRGNVLIHELGDWTWKCSNLQLYHHLHQRRRSSHSAMVSKPHAGRSNFIPF